MGNTEESLENHFVGGESEYIGGTYQTCLHVPEHCILKSDYVKSHHIRIPNKTRVAIGDVKEKLRDLEDALENIEDEYEMIMGEQTRGRGHQLYPPPKGYWEEDPQDGGHNFVIIDGRHRVYAMMLWGFEDILVCWNELKEDQ